MPPCLLFSSLFALYPHLRAPLGQGIKPCNCDTGTIAGKRLASGCRGTPEDSEETKRSPQEPTKGSTSRETEIPF